MKKLIRDNVFPATGEVLVLTDDDKFHEHLRDELEELVTDYFEAKTTPGELDALADVMECCYALASLRGVSVTSMDNARNIRANLRGRFNRRKLWVEP